MENLSASMAPESQERIVGPRHSSEPLSYCDDYYQYARPLTAQLLKAFQLDMNYTRGAGNWLWGHREDGIEKHIFDGTGGYGANLLGHSHPHILAQAEKLLASSPNLVQGSWRNSAGRLGKKISEILSRETGQGPWISHLTNSGAECAEAALKHVLLSEQIRSVQFHQLINRSSHLCPTYKKEENLALIENERPLIIAIESAYHGKTMGALGLTHNSQYKLNRGQSNNGDWEVVHIPRNDVEALKKEIHSRIKWITLLDAEKQLLTQVPYLPLAAVFIEAIQGEGGIQCLQSDFLHELRQLCDQWQASLVADEIQSGLFRTGKMAALSHHQIVADIYLFSKALGAGVAKIGATCIRHRHYHEEFGMLHTSTFAEDTFSSEIALHALHLIDRPALLERSIQHLRYAYEELLALASEFPGVIKEIRGKGAMLAIEFKEELLESSFEFRILGEHGLFGHYLSSLLLNNERIRMAPTLSSPMSLRWEPSINIEIDEIQFFILGLHHLCEKLKSKDAQYLFGNLGGIPQMMAPLSKIELSGRPLTVFLCHIIDQQHLQAFCPSLSLLPPESYKKLSEGLSKIGQFAPYIQRQMVSETGSVTDLILMAAPIDSQHMANALKNPVERSKIISKIQAAIDWCAEQGVQSVGLGQFTSIISNNGLDLDDRGMNLTTGNSYTAALSLEAGIALAQQMGRELSELRVGVVGAAGNIMSTTAQYLLKKVKHLALFYHTPWEQSPKWQMALKDLVLANQLNQINTDWKDEILELISRERLSLEHQLHGLKDCDLVFIGTNDPGLKFPPDFFRPNAVIIDTSVPSHFNKQYRQMRPDLKICLGGLATLPLDPSGMIQGVSSDVLPCPPGESYACLTETILMSWMGLKGYKHLGPVTLSSIERTQAWAQQCGVKLGRLKSRQTL